ncbi:MAG: M16 family metallopeptidase [Candidatus Rokuibacteriota bacterium]
MHPPTCFATALLVLLLVSGCSAGRQAATGAGGPSRHVLSNGVRVIVEQHRGSDVVALQLWVQAGGRDEAASELGLAHYLEHMLFKGTATRPAGFIDREVEGVGGRMNAGTSLDYTYYHMLLPARRARAGIETLADVSVNAALDETQVEREKRVVLEEMRLGEDTPRRFLARQLYEALFQGHPYGRPVIGREDLIRALTREQLLAFYRRHYVPESFTLVVVGAVTPDEVLDVATRAFGRLPRIGLSRLPITHVAEAQPRRLERQRPGVHAYLGLAWLAPRLDHADTPAVDVLAAVMGHSRSARLTRTLRDRLGLVNSISASYAALEGAGVLSVTAQLDPANLPRAQAEILAEAQRLRRDGITTGELERAVTTAEARREFRMETAEGRAFRLGHAETIWRIEDELAYVDRVRSVALEQVRAAAQRYLDPERFARVALMPTGPK